MHFLADKRNLWHFLQTVRCFTNSILPFALKRSHWYRVTMRNCDATTYCKNQRISPAYVCINDQNEILSVPYQRTIARAILWFHLVGFHDGFQAWTRLRHRRLSSVRRNTKVLLLGSLPSTLLDYLASWASLCRPIYPRTRLNRRNEPERPTSVETVRTERNETICVWRNRWMALGDRGHGLRNSYLI